MNRHRILTCFAFALLPLGAFAAAIAVCVAIASVGAWGLGQVEEGRWFVGAMVVFAALSCHAVFVLGFASWLVDKT